jgi:hypothetical protein
MARPRKAFSLFGTKTLPRPPGPVGHEAGMSKIGFVLREPVRRNRLWRSLCSLEHICARAAPRDRAGRRPRTPGDVVGLTQI